MLDPHKSLMAFRTNLMTAKEHRRLKKQGTEIQDQHDAFAKLIPQLAKTNYGRTHEITAKIDYPFFQENTPLASYEQIEPYVQKMIEGSPNELWPGTCRFFGVTSGTSNNKPKRIPVTEEMLQHFQSAELQSLLYYTSRTGHAGIFKGRHLHLGGINPVVPYNNTTFTGDLCAITELVLPHWMNENLHEPDLSIAQITDWDQKLEAIASHVVGKDLSLINGIPNWIGSFIETVDKQLATNGSSIKNISSLWPNLECICHHGIPISPYLNELSTKAGKTIHFHETYPTAEGFIAAQDSQRADGLRLMCNTGIFFEFLPVTRMDKSNLASCAPYAIPLSEVTTGIDYALIVTTPAGLCRYFLGDVVRFQSTTPPRLIHIDRADSMANAFQEGLTTKDITGAITTICNIRNWTLTEFHLAPIFKNENSLRVAGRHEWWVELKPPSKATPISEKIEKALDAHLSKANPIYEAKRTQNTLGSPLVRLVMPGVFKNWMKKHNKWGGQNKMPRASADRQIADELMKLAGVFKNQECPRPASSDETMSQKTSSRPRLKGNKGPISKNLSL